MAKLEFQIVTPEREVLAEQVDSLSCPTTTGQITILPGHVPIISNLQAGELVLKIAGKAEPQYIAVSGGFVEVRPGNKVVILADTAERDSEIDAKRAEQAKLQAEESMKEKQTMSKEEYATVSASLQKNLARLKVVRRKHHSHGSTPSSN